MKISLPAVERRLFSAFRFFVAVFFRLLPYLAIAEVHRLLAKTTFYEDMTDAGRFGIALFVIRLLILAGIFYSVTRIETLCGDAFYLRYHTAKRRPATLLEELRFFLSSPRFWAEFGAVVLTFVLLPLSFSHSAVEEWFGKGPAVKPLFLSVWLPFLFLLDLGGRLSAAAVWSAEKKQFEEDTAWARKKRRSTFLKEWISVFILYLFVGTLWQVLVPHFATFGALLTRSEFLKILLGIAAFFLFVALIRRIRALSKRRGALRRLRESCRENGFSLSPIRRPYRSLFRLRAEEDFTVTARGVRYSCKLIPAVRRGLPLQLSGDGIARYIHNIRIRGVTLFSWSTTHRFGYETEDKKILIVNPVPAKLLGFFEGKPFPLDNGDRVGDYLVYTPGSFLHMLELDCVEKKESAAYGYKK
ncbi:MAG: hypothetical protein IJR89_02410 [Clostridia bacterium]|nr:hypothetical protein [Clostridia bacterium]